VKQLPIPETYWRRILEFLQSGQSGRIELDVKDGKVLSVTIAQKWRDKGDEASEIAA
jgi:hypothetical protein